MAFDPNRVTEVEGMTAIDFGVWKSGKHAEVRSFLDDEFDIVLLHFIYRSVPTLREERRYLGGLFSAWLSWPTLTLPEPCDTPPPWRLPIVSWVILARTKTTSSGCSVGSTRTGGRSSTSPSSTQVKLLGILLFDLILIFSNFSQRTLGRCQGHRGGRHGSVRRGKEEARVRNAAQAPVRERW